MASAMMQVGRATARTGCRALGCMSAHTGRLIPRGLLNGTIRDITRQINGSQRAFSSGHVLGHGIGRGALPHLGAVAGTTLPGVLMRGVRWIQVGVPGTRPTNTRGWLRYILFFAPSHLAAGVALGGLVATIGATCWYLQATGRVNLWEQVDKMEKLVIIDNPCPAGPCPPYNSSRWPGYEHIDEANRPGAVKPNKFEIPLPLMMALLGWTASLLWTTARTAYRSRIDLELRTFFNDVTFTLLTQRQGQLAQRRLISRGLKSTLFCNEYLAATVRNACANVCVTDPVVRMPARHAPLVVQALQGPISEVSAPDHLHGKYKEVKHWYGLTCSSSSFRTVVISDELAQELMKYDVDKAGNIDVPTERVLHLPKNARRKDPAVRSLVAAIKEVKEREALFEEKRILPYNDTVPLVGWLNIPILDHDGNHGGPSEDRSVTDIGHEWAEQFKIPVSPHPAPLEQRAWIEALDAWEEETSAAVQRSMNRAGAKINP